MAASKALTNIDKVKLSHCRVCGKERCYSLKKIDYDKNCLKLKYKFDPA